MNLQQKLARLMRLHSKSAVAKAAGISLVTLNNVLEGKHRPTYPTATGLARVLHVQHGWLVDDTQDWPPVRVGNPDDVETETAASHAA